MDASTSAIGGPVLLMAQSQFLGSAANDGAVAYVTVAPAPSPMPSPAWTTNATNVQIQDEPSLPGSIQMHATSSSTSSGTLSANVPTPVGQVAQTPVYVFAHLSLECHHIAPTPADNTPEAYAVQSGNLVPQTDPSTSDIYIDGPNCIAPFNNPAESVATIHFPSGGTTISAFIAFNTITASLFANTETSIPLNYTSTSPAPYALLFADKNGGTSKIVLEIMGNDYPDADLPTTQAQGSIDGPFCTFGSCADGT
jgi:hypothetical protein